MKHILFTTISLLITASSVGVNTALAARGPVRSIAAVRTDTAPVIDGKIDESCWSLANVATDFTNYRTESLAVEQTFVRVLYDDDNMYVAFECLEPEPERIIGMERKYDQSLHEEDAVEIRFDTFGDRRSAYVFAVNTLGTRYDARTSLYDYRDDDTWGCDWSAACTVEEDRWFAEIAIPIGNIFFEQKDGMVWGANFRRRERGMQESSYWCYRNSQARYPREFGLLTNLDLAKAKFDRSPAFETYLSGTADFEQNTNKLSTGLDISMRLNSNIVSNFTINPDFSQVEADPDTIELRDTERFLRERRTFFREGSELFKTPMNIYYSRRLFDIDVGAKITGQGRDWALGLIGVQGEIEREDELLDGNYHVGRLIHNIGEQSHIGGIWANSHRSDGRNFTGGLDTKLYLDSTTSFSAQFLGLSDSNGIETDGQIDHSAYGLYTSVGGGTQPLWWNIDYKDISRGFRPDLGYIPRRNIRGPGSFIRYRDYPVNGPFKTVSAYSNIDIFENDNHETVLRDFYEGIGVTFHNEVEINYTRSDRYHAPYQNWYDSIKIEYNEEVDIWDSISAGIRKGVYEEDPYKEYFLQKPMRITNRLVTTFDGNYRVQKENGDEDIWLWRSVTQYSFPWNGIVKFTAEQTSEGRHNLTLLFSWEKIKKNMDLYFLLNDYETDSEDVQGAFVKLVYRF
ncbi:MAG: carbohydrate binding family 9 domain-containing protein [Planctomycetota bacterium]|jgi:hypothetical protein